MQLAGIIWIGATLVITSWCSAVCCGAQVEKTSVYNVLHSKGMISRDESKTKASVSNFSDKNRSTRLKEELLALDEKRLNVPLNIIYGDKKENLAHLSSSEPLFSTSGQSHSIELGNGALGVSVSNGFTVDKGIRVPSDVVHGTVSNLVISKNATIITEEQVSKELVNKNNTTKIKDNTSALQKVLDPSIQTLAAISRRAKRKRSNNHKNNHDRQKRSSFSLENIDFGDDKYLRNIVEVEKPQYEYRRPWRISEPKLFPIVKDVEYRSEKDYPKYREKEGIDSELKHQRRNFIPSHRSSLEDKYHKHTSSYYPISSSFVSDDSLPMNSISSSSYSASNLDSKEDISSSSSNHFNSKNSVLFKPYKNSDHRRQQYQTHQVHNHQHNNNHEDNNNSNHKSNNINNNNNIDLKESEYKDMKPLVVQSPPNFASLSVNPITNYGTKDSFNGPVVKPIFSSTNERLLRKRNGGLQQPIEQLAVEEPLALASQQVRLTSNKGGQREQLPAATSDIIDAGKSMARNIMKRRTKTKTGRYDVPQVGK